MIYCCIKFAVIWKLLLLAAEAVHYYQPAIEEEASGGEKLMVFEAALSKVFSLKHEIFM